MLPIRLYSKLSLVFLLGVLLLQVPVAWNTHPNQTDRAGSTNLFNSDKDHQDALNIWIEDLAKFENCSPLGTPDNGSLSYSYYCWKAPTWKEYARKAGIGINAEDDELMNLLGDKKLEQQVVRWIILNEYQSIKRLWWTTTIVKQLGLPPISPYPNTAQ